MMPLLCRIFALTYILYYAMHPYFSVLDALVELSRGRESGQVKTSTPSATAVDSTPQIFGFNSSPYVALSRLIKIHWGKNSFRCFG